jgi:hypothetical protein
MKKVTFMSTISAVSAASAYANNAPANSAVSAALAQVAATQLSVMNTLVSLGSNDSSSPLTYTAAGLFGSLRQTTSGTTNNATTNTQAAQNAYLEVQYAISQTLSSLVSGTSPNASGSDISSLFSLPGTANSSNPFGSSLGSLLNTSTGNSSTQAAQFAVINAQYALTQALSSMTSGSSSTTA